MEEKLEFIFGNINDWLKFAEAKAASLIALNGLAVFGILRITKDIELTDIVAVYVYAAIAQMVLSALISLASLIPSLAMPWLFKSSDPQPNDNIFYFESIAKHNDYSFLEALYRATGVNKEKSSTYESMLSSQIVTNSVIARRKFKLFKVSIWLLFSAIATPLGALILFEIK